MARRHAHRHRGGARLRHRARASEAPRASERPLFEFLVAEVLQQLPPALAEFLLDVSVLPELESGRCRDVTGNDRAAARLDAIERLGLFVDVLDAPVRTLRLHDLFRDALQLRLQQQDPARLARLRRRAAATEPDPVRRLSLLIDAGDTDAAAALAFDHLPSLVPAAGPASALHLIGSFRPASASRRRNSRSCAALPHGLSGNSALALAQLERAERGFAERGDGRRMEMARAESLMPLMAAGRLAEAAERVATFRLEELPTTTRIVVMNAQSWLAIDECRYAAVAPIVAAMLELLQGHSDRLDLWYQTTTPLRMPGLPGITPVLERRAALELQVAGDAPTPLRTLGLLTQAWCAVWSGNLDGARERVQAARSEAQWSGHSGAVRTHLYALTAVAATIAGDPARAIEAAEGRLQISGSRAPPWQRYLTRLFCARIAACCEHRAELQNAWRLLETERASIGALASPQGTRAREGAIAAQLAWLEGRADDAMAGWERALENDEEIDLMGQASEARVRLARALARRGDLHAAADRLAPVFSRARRTAGPAVSCSQAMRCAELATVRLGQRAGAVAAGRSAAPGGRSSRRKGSAAPAPQRRRSGRRRSGRTPAMGADRARARGARPHRGRRQQQADRARLRSQPAHGEAPRRQHPRQARRRDPRPGRRLVPRARDRGRAQARYVVSRGSRMALRGGGRWLERAMRVEPPDSRHCRPSPAKRSPDRTEWSMSPIITVFGATGAQGGGLARAILADPQRRFRLRAVTRKPGVARGASRCAEQGAEVVVADLDDADSVRRAMAGAARRVLRHELLGALLAGEGNRAGAHDGAGRERRRRAARGVVDAGGHARVRARRQRPACRC